LRLLEQFSPLRFEISRLRFFAVADSPSPELPCSSKRLQPATSSTLAPARSTNSIDLKAALLVSPDSDFATPPSSKKKSKKKK